MVVRSIEAWHKQGTFEPKSWQQFIESYIHTYIYIYVYFCFKVFQEGVGSCVNDCKCSTTWVCSQYGTLKVWAKLVLMSHTPHTISQQL